MKCEKCKKEIKKGERIYWPGFNENKITYQGKKVTCEKCFKSIQESSK